MGKECANIIPSVELMEDNAIENEVDDEPSDTLIVTSPSGSVKANFLATA
jgi:hypothetical protein